MAISYKKLWKLLIDKDMKKKDLQRVAGISAASVTKLGKNENVNTEIIEKICVALQCDVSDIMEMVEDKTILQQLWGKELVVTTGLGFQSQKKLKEFIEQLVKYHSVGLVINTGKYVFDIDQEIIDYCNELSFPLLVVPWEVHIADMIKDFSYHCLRAERDDKYINQTVMDTLINPAIIEESRNKLAGDFDVENDFQVMAISVETDEELGMMERRSIKFQLELCFEKVEGNYSFFWFDGYYIMIFNNLEDSALVEVINEMYKNEASQLEAMCRYIEINGLVNALKNKDWKAFALGYNGKAYKENNYDVKLGSTYKKFKT